ncbi:MAG: hypothetical protein ABJF10_03175 [Chthoniobacter sp.]|uniref:hypothetical protein n=1 Tax=Chthoniobacter sp. TaxID=2510640 RepID=UPI0032A4878E
MKSPTHPRLKHGRISAAWRWLGQPAKGIVCVFACGLPGIPAWAAESPPGLSDSIQHLWKEATSSIQFGGFVSQGFLVNTGHNNYLGETSKGTFDFREYAVNASYAIGQFRFGMQVFGQKLGEYGDDKLDIDWATADYQPAQWFGLRAGRVKMPRGLYNEALDLDSVRPFVLLPQSVYDARLRDFNAAFNGAMIFGNIGLKKLGSLDYRVFYGDIPIATDSGASDYFNNDFPSASLDFKMDSVVGGSLFWNTPLSGLRVGYSYNSFENLRSTREATLQLSPLAPLARVVGTKQTDHYGRHLFSIEYTKGDWVLAAEAGREEAIYHIGTSGVRIADTDFTSNYFYVSAARRINRWLELGAYYSYSRDSESLIGSTTVQISKQPALTQADLALSARFDISDHLIFKLEGHYMDGAGKIFDTVQNPQPVAGRDAAWFLFAAKLTYSF